MEKRSNRSEQEEEGGRVLVMGKKITLMVTWGFEPTTLTR